MTTILVACASSSDSSPAGGGGGSTGNATCSTKELTCGDVLPAATLTQLQSSATPYSDTGSLPCRFTLPNSSSGIIQAFCGGDTLLAEQLKTAQNAYPGSATETDTIGSKSFELVVGSPGMVGSTAEVAAVTTSGKYVFNVSLVSAAADIAAARSLAQAIDQRLSAH